MSTGDFVTYHGDTIIRSIPASRVEMCTRFNVEAFIQGWTDPMLFQNRFRDINTPDVVVAHALVENVPGVYAFRVHKCDVIYIYHNGQLVEKILHDKNSGKQLFIDGRQGSYQEFVLDGFMVQEDMRWVDSRGLQSNTPLVLDKFHTPGNRSAHEYDARTMDTIDLWTGKKGKI